MGERNKKILLEQSQLPCNNFCADCRAPEPEWASCNVGVFLCVNCSGIHRMLGTHISRVKSCRLDQWDDDSVQFMCERGNEVINNELEKYIPPYYVKPTDSSSQVLKEQFIHAKYGRKEFSEEGGTNHYETGDKEGYLYKRGKDAKQYKKRKFVLNRKDKTIKYFVKPDAKDHKQIIDITKLHASLAPAVIDHSNGLQLSFQTNNTLTRHIYLYAENGKDAVDWFITLRAIKYNWLKEMHPEHTEKQILFLMERSLKRQGWMSKTGPKKTESYRRRWFVLDDRKLLYFGSPLDAYPKGEVYLGTGTSGYMVRDGLPAGQEEDGFGITVTTPERDYLFLCEDQDEQRDWINDIKSVISQPLSKKDSEDLLEYKSTYQTRRKSMHRIKSPTHWAKTSTQWV